MTGECFNCKGSAPFDSVGNLGLAHKYPIVRNDRQYGIIRLRTSDLKPLSGWRDQLLRSTADQLAIALSLNETKEQSHRLAMLNERTVIARELHDSLAQALSYLKIQVTRLQKSHDAKKYDLQQPILEELKEGLSSAYRHLRELLTTFRLKIDEGGLENALTQTIEQLLERTEMDIQLEYQLHNVPLNPMEEIHLLQIAREASQNAVNHSGGERLQIRLFQNGDKSIELLIEDDGRGLPQDPKKLNHYGLAIMQERSKHLKGNLAVSRVVPHGTRIHLKFEPHYLQPSA
jgi:two-component system nitrate/nitrite sensor histidine kinase NarX